MDPNDLPRSWRRFLTFWNHAGTTAELIEPDFRKIARAFDAGAEMTAAGFRWLMRLLWGAVAILTMLVVIQTAFHHPASVADAPRIALHLPVARYDIGALLGASTTKGVDMVMRWRASRVTTTPTSERHELPVSQKENDHV